MKVVQLIDSLDAGGAESMAVNYANALATCSSFSGLVVTRKEGILNAKIADKVDYLFLNRKRKLDLGALLRFKGYLKRNEIAILHAHSSSFFFAVLLKIIYPKIKIVWHDHFGNREKTTRVNKIVLKFCSYFFHGIITCNVALQKWAKENLATNLVRFVPNFVEDNPYELPQTVLKGVEGKRIVCLSNLKHPKNHLGLLQGFLASKVFLEGWTLHLVGKNYEDAYAFQIDEFMLKNKLQNAVYLYGVKEDVRNILKQAEIGILCSTYEGFPVVLLEYGISHLAVVSTHVGFCSEVIQGANGLLFDPYKTEQIAFAISKMVESESHRIEYKHNLNRFVKDNFSEKVVIKNVLKLYDAL